MRVLITGGSGLLAMNWAYQMKDKHDICLLTHTQKVNFDGVLSIQSELDDPKVIHKVFSQFMPDLIVHTAGFTNVDECEKDPGKAKYVNTVVAANVANAANQVGASLVHISTDHLYHGDKANVDEDEAPDPINEYGHSKLDGEHQVLKYFPGALVVRTNFYGWGHRKRESFTDWIIRSLSQGCTIKAFEDVYITPAFVDDLVKDIHQLVELNAKHVVNVISDQRISKYHFALAVADEFGLNRRYIEKSNMSDVSLYADRPKDMSLNNSKARKLLGRKLGTVAEGLSRLHLSMDRKDMLNQALL